MLIYRVLAIVLGSLLFFPVCFISALSIGTYVLASLDARDISNGDKPHSLFYVIGFEHEKPDRLIVRNLDELNHEKRDIAFLLPSMVGSVDVGSHKHAVFHVKEVTSDTQVVEVRYSNGDIDVISRYRVAPDGITPLYSKLYEPGYMFAALPFALVFSLATLWLGKYMRRKGLKVKAS